MRKNLLFVLMMSLSCMLMAQRPSYGQGGGRPQAGPSVTGKITGILLDSVSREGMSYATVSLMGGKENKLLNGTLTDETGRFKLTGVKTGTYTLRITSLGYKPLEKKGITTTLKKPDYDLGKIQLSPTTVSLEAVEITGEAAIIENRVDKIVYNADRDITSAGGDASDVLRKVPLLSVDLEGNVSLRGSQNIRILVNGKPSGMFANSVAAALRTIPAQEIKSVEVITTPSAKYDGEGSAGIINLITKRKQLEGINGSVNGALGNLRNNGSFSFNAGIGRLSLNSNFSYFGSLPRESRNSFFREDFLGNGLVRTLDQTGEGESFFNGWRGSAGLYYDFNAYNSFSSNFNLRGFDRGSDEIVNATFIDPSPDATINDIYVRDLDNEFLQSGYDWTTDYTRTFKKKGQELSVGVQVNGDISTSEIDLLQQGSSPGLFIDELTSNEGNNLEITTQLDYTHPFTKSIKLETGAKAIIRDIDSDYRYEFLDQIEQRYVTDEIRSNIFDYDQDVFAGYASLSANFGKKYSLIAGARYEHTNIRGQFNQGADEFSNEYDNVLPSIILSRKLKGFSTLKLSFNQRIQRPSLFFLNPFRNESDPRNVSEGNPELAPEITDQYELGYTTIIKKVTLSTSIYYRNTRDIIENALRVNEDGSTITTYQNVGENDSWGTNIFVSLKLKDFWTLRGNFNLFTYDATGIINGQQLSNQAILWSGNLNSTFRFKHGFSVEVFGFLRSPRQSLQGSQTSFSIISFGAKKEIFDKKGSIGIQIIEPWAPFKRFDGEFSQEGVFNQTTVNEFLFRSIGVSFGYRFGKLTSRGPRKRSKIRNDDAKQGDSNNF
ncbi:MAG: TonB-dependent receptor [Bacteroidota bacterium]